MTHGSQSPRLIAKAISGGSAVASCIHWTTTALPVRGAPARNHAATKMKAPPKRGRKPCSASLAISGGKCRGSQALFSMSPVTLVAGHFRPDRPGPESDPAWPDKPITFIVPCAGRRRHGCLRAPGSQPNSTHSWASALIENRPVQAAPWRIRRGQGRPRRLHLHGGAAHHASAPSLYPNLDYNIEKDFIAVGLIARPPQVIVGQSREVTAKTLAEFIAYAKANPGKMNYGSAGAGTTHHLAGELFRIRPRPTSSMCP